jgi:hypothetical protein
VQPFTSTEAEPLLRAVSKMHPVTLVEESPFAAFSAHPRICLLYNAQFVGLSSAMLWFDGKTSWTVVSDLPRCYLLAGLSWNKGLTQRFYGAEAQQVPHFEAGLSDRENQIPKTPEEFREWAIEDMPRLAALIEEKLNLEHKLSLGVEVSAESLELPLVEDSAGRGNQTANVYLVAHPEAFLQKRTPTSPWDRLLHFWITDDEYGRLFDYCTARQRPSGTFRCWHGLRNKTCTAVLLSSSPMSWYLPRNARLLRAIRMRRLERS